MVASVRNLVAPGLRVVAMAFFLNASGAQAWEVPLIIPEHLRGAPVPGEMHPHSTIINAYLLRQQSHMEGFKPTGYTRADYLPVIDSIARGMGAHQNAAGRIIDPVLNREHQYSTPAYAHAVAVLFKSGYLPMTDTAMLNSGIRAMDASVTTMLPGNSVPDGHGDFYTILIMMAFENFKGVVTPEKQASWRASIGNIPTSKYNNAAPNWIGINLAGEFLRYREDSTRVNSSLAWVQQRMSYQITRMGLDGMYQDDYTIETQNVVNTGGNSVAYDMVARTVLNVIATAGYDGIGAEELRLRLWRGAWTGLLYQSGAGEVPTGMRSSHHLWNESYAAATYEMWARQYAMAGQPEIAGAFKRAAHLSLHVTKQWLRPNGLGYITKARYPASARWGYMAYSGLMQYNGWTASSLALAWQMADTSIAERPAPADIGGYVMPVIPGFKKVFANAGGTYVQYDLRGDQSHNPTGLLRLHLRGGHPLLGPSDGAVGPANQDQGAQYRPQYPSNLADPSHLQNISVGPGWPVGGGQWQVLAALTQIPEVTVLEQTTQRASFRVTYNIGQGSTLHQTVIVEPTGVTVVDSVVGGSVESLRIFYPMLVTDGEDSTTIAIDGNHVTLGLHGKGSRFTMIRPSVPLTRNNVIRNHRNGRMDAVYADVPGRVAEYRVTAWPVFDPTFLRAAHMPQAPTRARIDGAMLRVEAPGAHRAEVRDVTGRLLWRHAGYGASVYDLREVGALQGRRGVAVVSVRGEAVRFDGMYVR